MTNSSHEIFTFDEIHVFFKHTDYHGFVHPYNYCEWMSYTRESFFQKLVPNFLELCNRNIKMVTALTEIMVNGDAIFGDKIIIQIYSENVRRLSFDVIFKIYKNNTNNLICNGQQRLTFLDAVARRPALIPPELKEVVLRFERKESTCN